MRYVLLMVIGMGAVMLPRVAIATQINDAMVSRVGVAISKAAPLLRSKRLNLLRVGKFINDNLKIGATDADVEESPSSLYDKLVGEHSLAKPHLVWLELGNEMRELPSYMDDPNGLLYDVLEYPLHAAVARGNYQEVMQLLKKGKVGVNDVDRRGATPLHLAADLGDMPMAALLLHNGAKINTKVKQAWRYQDLGTNNKKRRKEKVDNSDVQGLTAAHLAVVNRRVDMLALLLLEDAKFDIAQRGVATPVHLAAAQDFMEALLMFDWAGIDFNLKVDGRTPLEDALQHNQENAVDFLTQPEAKRTRKKYLNRALLRVVSIAQLKLLLERNAMFVGSSDAAVLSYAQREDDSPASSLLIGYVIDELSGDANASDDGIYALQYALAGGNAATIEALLERGADPLARKKDKGKTHFERARKLGLAHLFIPYLKDRTDLPKDVAKVIAREEVINSSDNKGDGG